ALAALKGNTHHPPLPQPHVILLDLNLPRMSGLEFLRALRQDPELRPSVVFVWTTSTNQADIQAAYEQVVAGYLVKSRVGANPAKLLDLLQSYCQMVIFPT
ncbi:MAG TPA: response regulator, partial [Caldilineaceae bacterium]|nr:response regulator [Caldilineaceae bacterium]